MLGHPGQIGKFGPPRARLGGAAARPTANGSVTVSSRGSVGFNLSTKSDYYTYAKGGSWGTFVFPDGDWTICTMAMASWALGTAQWHLFNIGSFGVNGLVAMFLSAGSSSPRLNAQVRTTATTTITMSVDFTPDNAYYLLGIRRNGSNIELFRCALGGAIEILATGALSSPAAVTPNGTTAYVGARSDQNTNSFYQGNVSYLLKLDGTISDGTIAQLAAGSDPMTDLGLSPAVYTRFDSAGATITDSSGNGHTATKVGSPVGRGGPSYSGLAVDVTSPSWGRVFQRTAAGTSGRVTFTGTYKGSPAGFKATLLDASNSVLSTSTQFTYPSAGQWSTTLTVPQGRNLTLQVEWSNDSTKYQRTQFTWGVGVLIMYAGQSNAVNQFASAAVASITVDPTKVGFYTSSAWTDQTRKGTLPAGAGVLQAISRIQSGLAAAGTDIPVGAVNGATTGSALVASAGDNWQSGTPLTNFTTVLAAVGSDCEQLLWIQGEADADNSVSRSDYATALIALIPSLRTLVGRSSSLLPAFIEVLGHRGSVEQGTWNAIRLAHRDGIASIANCFHLGTDMDLPLTDQLHYTSAGYERFGQRIAQAQLNYYVPATYTTGMHGAEVASAVINGSDIDVTFTLFDGTALQGLTGATGLTGFVVKNGSGVVQTISATAIPAANKVRLTPASPPASNWTVEYCPNALVTVTNLVYSNASVVGDTAGVPAYSTAAAITL